MEHTYLSELTKEELTEVLKENPALSGELCERAQEDVCEFYLDDFFHNAPRGVDYNIGYPDDYCSVLRHRMTYDDEIKAVEWLEDLARDYCFMPDGFIDRAERVKKYISVLADGVAKEKDEAFMDEAVDAFFKDGCAAVLAESVALYEQFYDDERLAEYAVESLDVILENYFMTESGEVFEERSPRKVG